MNPGARIKACRQKAMLSQEKVAELVGVSRQAVTKWESGQSAPSTENLFRLAEIFGTTVDFLLSDETQPQDSPAAQVYRLLKAEEDKKQAELRAQTRTNRLTALFVAGMYLFLYLLGRAIWVDFEGSSFLGWLWLASPTGAGSYLFGWLTKGSLFWASALLSALPALFGKTRFALTALFCFVVGFAAGLLLGPAAPPGYDHGWAFWGGIFLLSLPLGISVEILAKRHGSLRCRAGKIWIICVPVSIALMILLVIANTYQWGF